ncbi:MAG TPA: GNAT family N-acetyltransferase [Acidimicrobiales bacterium]|nr:GNAT family N-acetyltransferase [Acidimicrobiales bacterium]
MLRAGELTAELVYQRDGDQLVMVHTWVPVELRNQGIAGRLVEAAASYCRQEGLIAVGACSFARVWLARNRHKIPGLVVG